MLRGKLQTEYMMLLVLLCVNNKSEYLQYLLKVAHLRSQMRTTLYRCYHVNVRLYKVRTHTYIYTLKHTHTHAQHILGSLYDD